jgi:hypothetical protein
MKNYLKEYMLLKELESCSVEELECIAQEEYANYSHCDDARLEAALIQRSYKLNETFEWTVENKERLLLLNTKLMDCFEKLKTETTKACLILQKRVDTSDDFLQDFEIEAFVRPQFSDAEDDSIEKILEETWNEIYLNFHFPSATESIENALDDNIHFSRDLNWNIATPQLQGHFEEHYISYGIHELFDHTKSWSNSDILKINTLMAEYRVIYQHFTEIF